MVVGSEAGAAIDVRPLPAGSRLGRFQIVRRLAVGGMAELYLARVDGSTTDDLPVAIKRVHPHLAQDPDFAAMFVQEARIAATLDHPNIVRMLELGDDADEQFYAMEYLHGENVRAILREAVHRGGIPLECALSIVIGAARGLDHAHAQTGVVHRDVAPSNVIVTFAGEVKVVDFGIAKTMAQTRQTQAGVLKGKIGYMSPEQCRGELVDRRADVFGLGVLLYETTTGQRLFFADNQFAIMNKIVTGSFDRPSEVAPGYPEALERIVLGALAVEREDRFASARALIEALEGFAAAAGIRIVPTPLPEFMHSLFGLREYPRLVSVADVPSALAPPRRRVSAYTVAAVAAIPFALGLGIVVGGGLSDDAAAVAPAARPEAVKVSAPDEAAAPPVADVEAPAAQPGTRAADDAETDAELAGESDPVPESEPVPEMGATAPNPTDSRPRPKRKRKGRRTNPSAEPEPSAKPDRLFPDAYYEGR